MIKKLLLMSTGTILCCMIMMVSFAVPPNECADAKEDAKVCKDVIQNCKASSSDGLWVCDPPISQDDASVCLSACMEVSKKICKKKVPNSADVVMCDNCIDFFESEGNDALNVSNLDNSFDLMLFDEYGNMTTICEYGGRFSVNSRTCQVGQICICEKSGLWDCDGNGHCP